MYIWCQDRAIILGISVFDTWIWTQAYMWIIVMHCTAEYFFLFLDGCIFSEMHISSCDLFQIQNTCNKTSRLHSRFPSQNRKWKLVRTRKSVHWHWTWFKHMRNIYARSDGRMHQRSLILNHWDERIISLCCLILLQAEKFNYLILVKFFSQFQP